MNKFYYAQYDHGEGFDCWRFPSKQERDQWVKDRPSCAMVLTRKEAEVLHKDQFRYWKDKDSK